MVRLSQSLSYILQEIGPHDEASLLQVSHILLATCDKPGLKPPTMVLPSRARFLLWKRGLRGVSKFHLSDPMNNSEHDLGPESQVSRGSLQ